MIKLIHSRYTALPRQSFFQSFNSNPQNFSMGGNPAYYKYPILLMGSISLFIITIVAGKPTQALAGCDASNATNACIINNGTTTSLTTPPDYIGSDAGIVNRGTITTLNNSGTTRGALYGIDSFQAAIRTIINSGTISGTNNSDPAYGISNVGSTITTLTNNGNGVISGGWTGILNDGSTISSLDNSGTISAGLRHGVQNYVGGIINTFTNSGTISAARYGVYLLNNATIDTLTNIGTITGGAGYYGIRNFTGVGTPASTLVTLNNYQGVSGSGGSALTYTDRLPTFYNIIISGNGYGQLAATAINGQTTFGVSTLSTNIQPKTYSSVLTGVAAANITNPNSQVYTFGKHASLWLKQQAGSATTWDLVFQSDGRISTQFLGYDDPNVVNTYTAMNSNRQATEGILHQRYALLNALMQYDCNRFDKYGICIQFQTRATGYGTQATGSGILNASYRIANKFRVGAYLDYQAFQGNPFGMYLGTGGVQQNNNNPSFGGYVGYSQNSDETGVQARASGGYNPGQVSVLRAVLAGTEPGYGNAGLNAYYAYGVAGYGVKIADGLVVTPYGGIQYTDVTRNGYTEQASLFLTIYPLAYNSYYERLITGLFGAKAKGMLTDKLGYQLSLGAQVDFTRSANSYSGYSYVPGMESYGIAHGGGWNGVRPAGMAGVFYDPLPNHRVSLNAYTSQQAWTTRTYTTGLLGYQIAF